MASPYFRPSLRVPAAGKWAVATAAMMMVPCAWIYAWTTAPGPTVLNLLRALGMGLWLALAAATIAGVGKIRHPRWMGWAGAGLGAMAWYVHWAAWFVFRGHSDPSLLPGAFEARVLADLCMRPDLMFMAAAQVAGSASSLAGSVALVVVWLVELAMFLILPAIAGTRRAGKPFCEQTASWARVIHVPVQFEFVHDPNAVRRRLERMPDEVLSVLVPCSDDAAMFADVTIHRCRGRESFITICNFEALAPEQVPLPGVRDLSAAMPDRVSSFGQVDEPVVELLRFRVDDVDLLLRQWDEQAAARTAGSRQDAR
jgi:hypothetical protein